jgi:hypothetical protein
MIGRILVLMRAQEEIELGQALVAALPETPFLLVFGGEDLRTKFGDTPHPNSADLSLAFLEAHTLRLAVCFSGARELGPTSNLLLLSFLNEVGIPTLEIQRDLLQDTAAAARASVARHYLSWVDRVGSAGIGNLKSVLPPTPQGHVRDDVVAVTSRLDGSSYTEEERYRFVFAIMRLARETPATTFIWRQSVAETQLSEVAPFWTLVTKLGPKNLVLEENEALPALFARASAVLGMAATPLLAAAAAHKPGLVFVSPAHAPGLGGLTCQTFRGYSELREAWPRLRREPLAFTLGNSLPALSPAQLAQHLAEIAQTGTLAGDPLTVALHHLNHYESARTRLKLERLAERADQRASKHENQIEKVLERIGLLQRSSVAYKALKLFGRVRKSAFKR